MSTSLALATCRRLVAQLAFGLLALTCAAGVSAAPVAQADAASKSMRADLAAPLQAEGVVRVIVGLQTPAERGGVIARLPGLDAERAVARRQERLLQRLTGTGSRELKRLRWHPFIVLNVDANGLARLQADPEVTTLAVDHPRAPGLVDTPAIVRATQAWAAGARGAGRVVAILDSGVDATHSFFGGKIVAEACFSTPVGTGVSYCPGGTGSSTAAGSGAPCPDYSQGCWHGTHVAGIAAGKSGVLGATSGIAPDAGVIAVQVFQRPCTGCTIVAYDSDILAALEHVYSLRTSFDIAAVNLSLGGGLYGQTCDAVLPAYKQVFDTLRSANIAPVVSTGNDSSSAGISAPACVSSAISVGSTTKQGAVSSFSNSAAPLSLLAPGSSITSSVPLAYIGGGFAAANGTSMAAPHVTGAWAALRSLVPSAGVPSVLTALQTSGVPITDPRNGLVRPLIQVGDSGGLQGALGLLRLPPTVALTAPANGATYTAPASIALTANATPNATGAVISKVEFYAGASKIGEVTTPPYAFTWAGVAQGGYSLTALARDSHGNSATSAAVGVSVAAGAPLQISGTVTLNGNALAGVSLGATNGGTCGNSDAAGQYNCSVPAGWNGTVTPTLAGYTFTPVSRSYAALAASQTAQNYAATPSLTISGTVTLGGNALAGVSLGATSGGSCDTSNAAGQYGCSVPSGWSGTITPTLAGHTFTPVSRSYSSLAANQTAQDYVATQILTISGTVTLSGNALSGVSLAASNGGSCGSSNTAGQYACSVPSGWSGTVTPSLSGHTFTPASRSYTALAASQSAQNYTAAVVVYTIGGTVTLGGNALSGVNMTATSGGSCGASNAAGQYSCTVPAGWTGWVTPSLGGHVFTPVARSYSGVAANQTLQDYSATAATVWFDDAAPAGATLVGQTDGWNWVAANPTPNSGALAHQSALLSGEHQHYFISAPSPLMVGVGDTLFVYVYLDPANPPSQIMVKWNDGTWEHRAYWGANIMQPGVDGTASRRSMGPLPPTGQWVRLEVPAALVALEGRAVNGMAFTTYNGRTTWDYAGVIRP